MPDLWADAMVVFRNVVGWILMRDLLSEDGKLLFEARLLFSLFSVDGLAPRAEFGIDDCWFRATV